MPYVLVRSGQGFKVQNEENGRTYSHLPLSKTTAQRQMRAIYASENGYVLRSRSRKSSPYNVRRERVRGDSRRKSFLGGSESSPSIIGGSLKSIKGLQGGRKYKCSM
jgi:hypothetical protein